MAVSRLDPVGNRPAHLVVGEVLGEAGRVELDLARRRRHGEHLGRRREAGKPRHHAFPILNRRNELVLALLERLPVAFLLGDAARLVTFANLVLGALALGEPLPKVLVAPAVHFERASDALHRFPVGPSLANVLDGLLLVDDRVPLPAIGIGAEVGRLEFRGDGKHDVSEASVVLEPRRLHDVAFQIVAAQCVVVLVAAVQAGGEGGVVRPEHLDARHALGRELELLELVGAIVGRGAMPVPAELLAAKRFVDMALRDLMIGIRADHPSVEARARRRSDLRGRNRAAGLHTEKRPLDELDRRATGEADSLHAHEVHLEARRLGRESGADERPTVAVADRDVVTRPVASERLDLVRRNAADGLCPFGRLRNPVFLTQHVVFEPVEADGVGVDVLLLVGSFRYPHVRDSELERRIGVRQDGNPLVGMHDRRVVRIGGDRDMLHAAIIEPEGKLARQLAAPSRRGRFEVATPVQHGVSILSDILRRVGREGVLPDRVHSPCVLGAPVPTFPAVRVARLHGVAAAQVEHRGLAAMAAVHRLAFPMAVGLAENCVGTVLVVNAFHLGGDELASLVPADADVLARAAVLRVPLAFRIPVDTLHGERDAVLGIRAALVHKRERRRRGLHARLERLAAPALKNPIVQLFFGVIVFEAHGANADELAVLHIRCNHVRTATACLKTEVVDDGFV